MNPGPRDVAQIRLANALALFDEFVHTNVKHADAATLRGLEGRFAEKLQIQPSYWSQIKGRSRQIGERLARQFEQLCRKPAGWMDEPHGNASRWNTSGRTAAPAPEVADDAQHNVPQDDDERFIVGLVLPTTGATRSARARACSTCSARCSCPRPRRRLRRTSRPRPPTTGAICGARRRRLWRR